MNCTTFLFISFLDEKNVTLTVNLNNKENVYRLKTGVWERLPIIDSLKVNIRNIQKIRDDMLGLMRTLIMSSFTKERESGSGIFGQY
ncbi:MAG: hypothetical protein R2850_08455 [Bacteroidia bacterium]